MLIFSQKKKKNTNFCSPFKEEKNMIKQTKVMKSIKKSRKIAKKAYKILDAPGLTDNPSTDILDWSKKNIIAISLTENVYFFQKLKNKNKVSNLTEKQHNIYTSLKFSPSGDTLACGDNKGNLDIYNIQTKKKTSSLYLHNGPITSITFKSENTLSTGSQDKSIKSYDLRSKKIIHNHKKHKQEIIRLKWDNQGSYLASSGNDNLIYIWDARKDEPIRCYSEHRGAVRGLAWAPNCFGSFVSGDDGVDGCVKFWNVNKKKSLKSVDTGERVFNLGFGGGENGFVSTHGGKGNRIMVWDNGVRERICVMDGHFMRVLHLAVGPGGEDVITAAGDETLKFWKVFHREKKEIIQPTCFSHYLKDLR